MSAGAVRIGHSRFAELVAPNAGPLLAERIWNWLADAHEEAHRLQTMRISGRYSWANPYSFGTDRYQFLLGTADAMGEGIPDVTPDRSYNSLILKAGRAAIYPLRAKSNTPHGAMLDGSEWQRELGEAASDSTEPALINRVEALLGNREILFLPWSGSSDLTNAWVGQGTLTSASTISWDWLHPLRDAFETPAESRTLAPPAHSPVSPAPIRDQPPLWQST